MALSYPAQDSTTALGSGAQHWSLGHAAPACSAGSTSPQRQREPPRPPQPQTKAPRAALDASGKVQRQCGEQDWGPWPHTPPEHQHQALYQEGRTGSKKWGSPAPLAPCAPQKGPAAIITVAVPRSPAGPFLGCYPCPRASGQAGHPLCGPWDTPKSRAGPLVPHGVAASSVAAQGALPMPSRGTRTPSAPCPEHSGELTV